MKVEIPSYVRDVMDVLDAAGHRAYVVGGSLRDILRGIVPHDYDMTTDATPDEMLQIFANFRVIPTGLAHGTVTVMSEGHPIEITTHRVDGSYLDARHPETVSFTRALSEDLSRRDFTVNAMAWHESVGVVDLFDGERDLEARVIRAVGDPEKRFGEDALRILRAFRFCAQLDFQIDEATLLGAQRAREGLARISVERIFSEFSRMMVSKNADAGLRAMLEADCAKYVFFDAVSALSITCVNVLEPDAALRTAALLPTLSREEALALARAWHAPNAFGEALAAYVEAAREPLPTTAYEARKYLSRYWHHWRGALALVALRGADISQAKALCEKSSRDGSVVEIRRLAVNGRELQEVIGIAPARTGELLCRLQDLVFRDPACNKRETLLVAAREICEKERDFYG